MDILLMTDHLQKLSAERHGPRRRALAGSGLAILAFALSAIALASMDSGGEARQSLIPPLPALEDVQ